jgi:hypothetical protein
MKPQMGKNRNPWYGERSKKRLFKIKRALTNTPALGLTDVIKSFFLYVHERLGTTVGVLTSFWHCLVVYLSVQLNAVSRGCLSSCAPWWPLPSWWLKQTNLLWEKNSQSEFPTLF